MIFAIKKIHSIIVVYIFVFPELLSYRDDRIICMKSQSNVYVEEFDYVRPMISGLKIRIK